MSDFRLAPEIGAPAGLYGTIIVACSQKLSIYFKSSTRRCGKDSNRLNLLRYSLGRRGSLMLQRYISLQSNFGVANPLTGILISQASRRQEYACQRQLSLGSPRLASALGRQQSRAQGKYRDKKNRRVCGGMKPCQRSAVFVHNACRTRRWRESCVRPSSASGSHVYHRPQSSSVPRFTASGRPCPIGWIKCQKLNVMTVTRAAHQARASTVRRAKRAGAECRPAQRARASPVR